MRKKLFVMLVGLFMVLSLSSCGEDVSYEKYDLNEYIEVGKYKGLSVPGYTVNVTEEDVQAEILQRLDEAASNQKLGDDATVIEGDIVNIDYVGKKDGKKFDGGSDEGYDLTIGSQSFIDGFEDGLIGKKAGEKVTLNLTFPEDYSSEELQGADVTFDVTINSISRKTIPEYDEEFVKNTSDCNTIEEYEQSVRDELYKTLEETEINNQKTELWSKVLDNTEVKKYPEKELNHYIDFNSKQIDAMAKAYGMTREEMLSSYGFGDEEEFQVVNEDSSKLRVKQEMIIEYIADKENITYTEKEAEKLTKEFTDMGYNEKTIEEQTGRTLEGYVRIELLYEKVLDFLLKNAKVS